MKNLWIGVAVLLALGCGGAEREGQATAGPGAIARARPNGPPASYVAESDRIVVRLDVERVRSSPVGDDIASLVRSYPTWRDLLGSSGIDPVRDFDRVLLVAPGAVADRSVLVIRHHLTNARIREAVLQMSVDRREPPQWREVQGFSVVNWPADTEVPRVVVLTSEHELVVTTPEDLDRVIAVAGDHAARRTSDELIEPAMTLDDGTIIAIEAQDLEMEEGGRFRYPPSAFRVTIREDAQEQGRIVLAAQGTYGDAASAETARRYFSEQRDFYAGQMLVRAVGLDRALRSATIAAEGNVVDLSASLTEEEIQRVLGLVALGGLAGGG